jgi:hypothetical protein
VSREGRSACCYDTCTLRDTCTCSIHRCPLFCLFSIFSHQSIVSMSVDTYPCVKHEPMSKTHACPQVELGRVRAEASMLGAEKRMLEDRVEVLAEQLRQGQQAWSNASRELSQLQVWELHSTGTCGAGVCR